MSIKTTVVATFVAVAFLGGTAAIAETDPPAAEVIAAHERLMRAAQLEPLMQIVATEGARHGLGLEASLFPGRGGAAWGSAVAAIQAPERLTRRLSDIITAALPSDAAADVATFLSQGPGARVVAREVTARREMLDGAVEAEAKRVSAAARAERDPRAALIDEVIDALDLVAANVSGGLNANFAFYRGLGDGGALKARLTESEMLAMVWGQEETVRRSTEDWLRSYLDRAYAPLPEDDLRDYLDFAESSAGKRYFSAMFAGFGTVFEETSYELGRAAAAFMVAEDA
jgi:hypothetical protein